MSEFDKKGFGVSASLFQFLLLKAKNEDKEKPSSSNKDSFLCHSIDYQKYCPYGSLVMLSAVMETFQELVAL